jgi:hypothetical protein
MKKNGVDDQEGNYGLFVPIGRRPEEIAPIGIGQGSIHTAVSFYSLLSSAQNAVAIRSGYTQCAQGWTSESCLRLNEAASPWKVDVGARQNGRLTILEQDVLCT